MSFMCQSKSKIHITLLHHVHISYKQAFGPRIASSLRRNSLLLVYCKPRSWIDLFFDILGGDGCDTTVCCGDRKSRFTNEAFMRFVSWICQPSGTCDFLQHELKHKPLEEHFADSIPESIEFPISWPSVCQTVIHLSIFRISASKVLLSLITQNQSSPGVV